MPHYANRRFNSYLTLGWSTASFVFEQDNDLNESAMAFATDLPN